MPLKLIKQDITTIRCDAIVNAANTSLLGGGGVDGAIHRAAGPGLLRECRWLGGCQTGQAKITGGYELPARYVIHTVGPVWRGGGNGEKELLRSCYLNSLRLAKEHGCGSVAFPLISAGAYGYPRSEAVGVAVDAISGFLADDDGDMSVYLTIFAPAQTLIDGDLRAGLTDFIERGMSPAPFSAFAPSGGARKDDDGSVCNRREAAPEEPDEACENAAYEDMPERAAPDPSEKFAAKRAPSRGRETGARYLGSIPDELRRLEPDESFSQCLLRLIDEKGMTDVQTYKKANVDRKLFSKIRSDPYYRPAKITAVAFALALELDLEQTNALLARAGFVLSHSNKFDLVIEYFITHDNYNVFDINEALFAFDQPLLGC